MTKQEFIGNALKDSYSDSQWKRFKKLSTEQLQKIEDLKKHQGEKVYFTRYGKTRIYTIKAVMDKEANPVPSETGNYYHSYPYNFFLDNEDIQGFWTFNIDAVEFINND